MGLPIKGATALGENSKPNFHEAWNQIQATMGEKPTPPRQIKKTLDKDDFLKIMISQLQYQDPMKPMDADKMANEMAQITSVEQLQNVGKGIEKLGMQNKPLERMTMTHLIGSTIQVDRNRFLYNEGTVHNLKFKLPNDAKSVKLTVVDQMGEEILKKDIGPQKSGVVSFNWDGLNDKNLPTKTGFLNFKVEAVNEQEQTIPIDFKAKLKIKGVSFEGAEPVFLAADGANVEKISMLNITQVGEAMADDPVPVIKMPGTDLANKINRPDILWGEQGGKDK